MAVGDGAARWILFIAEGGENPDRGAGCAQPDDSEAIHLIPFVVAIATLRGWPGPDSVTIQKRQTLVQPFRIVFPELFRDKLCILSRVIRQAPQSQEMPEALG